MKLDDIKVGERFIILAKGEPGTGKSIALASFAELGETYFFDFDQRMRSVALFFKDRFPELAKNINYDTILTYKDLVAKCDALEKFNPYKNVFADSYTSFSRSLISHMLGFRTGKSKKSIGDIDVPDWDDFNGEANGASQFVDFLRSLKCNVGLTAHIIETRAKGAKDKIVITRRLVNAGLKAITAEIPGYFDEAWHFHVKIHHDSSIRYKIVTRGVGEDWAKTALPLPPEIDFTNASLYREINKYIKAWEAGDKLTPEESTTISWPEEKKEVAVVS